MSNRTSGRKQNPDAEAVDPQMNPEAVKAASDAANALSVQLREIADTYGDGQEYDRARVVHEAKVFMSASAEAMLEAGKRLIVLRENEPHGEFTTIVEHQLGLNARTARVMMQAAVRYLNPALTAKRQTSAVLALGKSKLIELLVEPDEAIADLADGGTVAGLKVDDISAMSVVELRAALKKERDARKKDAEAKDRVIKAKEAKVSQLEEDLARRQSADPTEAEQAELDDVRDATIAADAAVRRLLAVAARVAQAPASESTGLAARQGVEYVAQVFAQLVNEGGIDVQFSELVTPSWLDRSAG